MTAPEREEIMAFEFRRQAGDAALTDTATVNIDELVRSCLAQPIDLANDRIQQKICAAVAARRWEEAVIWQRVKLRVQWQVVEDDDKLGMPIPARPK
jgi:hypothetical protein